MLDSTPSISDLSSANGDYTCRAGGHLDESTAIQASEIPADFVESYEAYTLDQEIQRADEAAAKELLATFAAAKESAGNVGVRVSRNISVSDEVDERKTAIDYIVSLSGASRRVTGIGTTPAEALQNALAELNGPTGPIAPHFGGYRIANVATVQAFPYRTRSEAQGIARRIVLDVRYLDGALEFALAGITDERPGPISVTVAA